MGLFSFSNECNLWYIFHFLDDDDGEIPAKVEDKTKPTKETTLQGEAGVKEAEEATEDDDSEPESEWEYFYEDAELKEPEEEQKNIAEAAATATKNPPAPPGIP